MRAMMPAISGEAADVPPTPVICTAPVVGSALAAVQSVEAEQMG